MGLIIGETGQELIELYASKSVDSVRCYDVELYNQKFDGEFGTLDELPRLWLGHP